MDTQQLEKLIFDLQSQLDKVASDLKALTDEVYAGNFSAHQDFNKYSNFTTRLKVPHYNIAPDKAEIGELIEYNGILYICSDTNVWTVVGSQS